MAIIDAHMHLMTANMFRRQMQRAASNRQAARERARVRGQTFQERIAQMESLSLADQARTWLQGFDDAGIQAAVFIAMGEVNDELAEFIKINPSRFYGCGSLLDPAHPDAAREVRRFRSLGISALKLYAPAYRTPLHDRVFYPVYEAAADQGLPIIVHFGITVGSFYDLTCANPLALSVPGRDFPEITFVIAHFGAGFLREAMLLAYHTENICVDTSGTNNWRLYVPGEPSLEQVFRDALRAFGPSRVLFGTDSTLLSGYRKGIVEEQVAILDRLALSPADRDLVLAGNARRVFGIAAEA
ncbi:MAG: amidohydrolase family protein [Armatimonadota bacterium]|nr:amidohydrolase family protein [Armatimonadota bacterium]